jgi:uncharacterized protein GlcG (DUF336 family)
MMTAAEAEAHGWPVAIVIADAAGDVVLALKRDQTQHSSLAIATGMAAHSSFNHPHQDPTEV